MLFLDYEGEDLDGQADETNYVANEDKIMLQELRLRRQKQLASCGG